MNLNPIFVNDFQNHIRHPVEQDIYEGKENIYFVFSYEDERSIFFGDDKPQADTAYMQLKLYTPKNYDYFEIKQQTSDFFENAGFIITSKYSYLESVLVDAERKRCTVFLMEYTGAHIEEE